MRELSPTPRQRFYDDNGNPLANGRLHTYVAGSAGAVNKSTYVARNGAANENPIPLDVRGECDLWLDHGGYLFVLKDADGNTIWTKDNISVRPNAATCSDRDEVQEIDPLSVDAVILVEQGHFGIFDYWFGMDLREAVTADTKRGMVIPPSSDITGANGAWVRRVDTYLNTALFGVSETEDRDENREAFQAAIDTATYFGKSLFTDEGTYAIDYPLTMRDNLKWLLHGIVENTLEAHGGDPTDRSCILLGSQHPGEWTQIETYAVSTVTQGNTITISSVGDNRARCLVDVQAGEICYLYSDDHYDGENGHPRPDYVQPGVVVSNNGTTVVFDRNIVEEEFGTGKLCLANTGDATGPLGEDIFIVRNVKIEGRGGFKTAYNWIGYRSACMDTNINLGYLESATAFYGNNFHDSLIHFERIKCTDKLFDPAGGASNTVFSWHIADVDGAGSGSNLISFGENGRNLTGRGHKLNAPDWAETQGFHKFIACRNCRFECEEVNAPSLVGSAFSWTVASTPVNPPSNETQQRNENNSLAIGTFNGESPERFCYINDASGDPKGAILNPRIESGVFKGTPSVSAVTYNGGVEPTILHGVVFEGGAISIGSIAQNVDINGVYAEEGVTYSGTSAGYHSVRNCTSRTSKLFKRGLYETSSAQTITSETANNPVATATFPQGSVQAGDVVDVEVWGQISGTANTKTVILGDGDKACGVLTISGKGFDGDTITINGHTITMKASGAAGAQVNIGKTTKGTTENIVYYINANTATIGVTAFMVRSGANYLIHVTANLHGTAPNAYGTTKVGGHFAWGAATLAGGTNAVPLVTLTFAAADTGSFHIKAKASISSTAIINWYVIPTRDSGTTVDPASVRRTGLTMATLARFIQVQAWVADDATDSVRIDSIYITPLRRGAHT